MTLLVKREATVLQVGAWAARGRLFAIVDATDTPSVPTRAVEAGDRAVSLYRGGAEEDLKAIAPFLFDVDQSILRWLTRDLWGMPWGILALSDASLEDMRSHFRRFLTVESPEGDPWYFRFYDPRVLVPFLESCTAAELSEFFGPVRALGVTDPDTYAIIVYAPGSSVPLRPRVQMQAT